MASPVHILDAGRTDFRRNLRKEGRTIRDLIVEAARAAIDDAGIDPGEIQSGVVGNFAAGLFTRQLHLGAFLTAIDDALRGLPTMHVEAACASGGTAVLCRGAGNHGRHVRCGSCRRRGTAKDNAAPGRR